MLEFIGNPNITRVFCYFEENNTGYFVMEYLDGCSLLDYIKAHNGRLTWDEAMAIALPIMDALTAMHEKGIIHRDVTPDNIYITNDGRERSLALWDTVAERETIRGGDKHTVGLRRDGTVVATGYNEDGRCNVSDWKDIKLPGKP